MTPLPLHGDYTWQGNYAGTLFLYPEDVDKASLLRKSLGKLKRFNGRELPSFWEYLFSNSIDVTNWSSFAKVLHIRGCEEELHVPTQMLQFTDVTIHNQSYCCIFRVCKGQTGIVWYGRESQLARLRSMGMDIISCFLLE